MQQDLKDQYLGFLNTPPLELSVFGFDYPPYPLKSSVDISSEDIPHPGTMVLGKRMECFFQHYVSNFTKDRVVAHNEQVIEEKLTLGEIDFLLKNTETGTISHVELVYKFYLYDESLGENPEARWIGPNRRDSLVKKLNRMKWRQFPLLFHPATKPLLNKLGITAEEVVQKICFKANLFLPFLEREKIPEGISESAVKGFYLSAEDLTADLFPGAVYFSPKKPDWPINPQKCNTWFSFPEIKLKLQEMLAVEQSPLVWMRTAKNEYFRFFVVWW
jgi:hypothetical protein